MGKGKGISAARRALNYSRQGGKRLSPKQQRRITHKNRKRLG